MKTSVSIISAAVVLGLSGCATTSRDLDGLEAKIAEAESGDFGTCMAQAHMAEDKLDKAKEVLGNVRNGTYYTANGYYESTGHKAAQAGMEHRQKAEEACMRILEPLEARIVANEAAILELDGRVSYLESLHEVLKGVTFVTGSAELTAQARTVLDVVANALQRRPTPVEIGGYASKTGTYDFNMELSQRRAESVRSYLVSKGVDGNLLSAKGYGWNDPVASNDTADGRRANQRVELHRQ
jgi:outer membrane protein OmpA-like peptidoglycan-associated protein